MNDSPEQNFDQEMYVNDTRSDHDEEYTLTLRVKIDKKTLNDFVSYFPKAPGGTLPAAVRWLLGGKLSFGMYLANATTNEHPDSINAVLATDSDNKHNTDIISELGAMTISIFGFNTPGWFYITKIRKVPFAVGSLSNRVIKADIKFCYNPVPEAENLPRNILNRIFELPNILEETKFINQRISHWDEYLKINENIAEEAQLLIDYSGVRSSRNMSRLTFDADCSRLSKVHLGSDIQLVTGVDYENGHPVYKGPLIGTLDSYFAKSDEVVINVDFEYRELLADKKAIIPHRAKLFVTKWGDLVQIRRLRYGLQSFARGQAANPYLDVFLFDSSKARYPAIPGEVLDEDALLQPNLNPEQKRAVEGVINSDDLYLIQGPPGTGKTTVIAEICYQNAVRGQKTLIASQTNLAVDNALGKLVHHPKIRALRKGNEETVQEEGKLFTENNVIKTWLGRVSDSCEKRYSERASALAEVKTAEEKLDFIEEQYGILVDAAKLRNTNGIKKASLERRVAELKEQTQLLEINTQNFVANPDDLSIRAFISNPCGTDDDFVEELNRCFRTKYKYDSEMDRCKTAIDQIRFGILKLQKLADELESLCKKTDRKNNFRLTDAELLAKKEISFERWKNESDRFLTEFNSLIQKKPSALVSVFKEPVAWLRSSAELLDRYNEFKISSAYVTLSHKDILKDLIANNPLPAIVDAIRKRAEEYISLRKAELEECEKLLKSVEEELESNKNSLVSARENINLFNDALPYGVKSEDIESLLASGNVKKKYSQLWKSQKNDDMQIATLQSGWIKRLREQNEYDYESFKQLYIDNANVIGITCSQSGSKEFTSLYPTFDVAIIDEVSKATPPELILSVLKAKKIVLVGDHKQLPPMLGSDTYEEVAAKLDLSPDKVEHMKQSLFEELFVNADDGLKTMLSTQYRMHNQIMDSINQFYIEENGFGLRCGLPNPDVMRKHDCHGRAISEKDHSLWVDVPMFEENREVRSGVNHSYSNKAEVDCIRDILLTLNHNLNVNGYEGKKQVGLISFYSNQVRMMEDEFNTEEFAEKTDKLSLRIGSVDRFQGIECPIVICSFVRNNDRGEIGFAKDPRRVNVALSRARELSVIVGCTELFCYKNNSPDASAIYKTITQNIFRAGGERSAWDFRQNEDD